MSDIYLGIDIGTQSVKVLCYDANRRLPISVVSSPLEMVSAADGTREQYAEWWLAAVRDCMAQIDGETKQRVAAIGVSGQQHGFVPLAADGSVLTPVKLWCDTTTAGECEQIHADFGGEQRCIDELGNAILPGYTASKIRWLKNQRFELYQRLATILLPHDYLNFYLTGERVMEYGDASGTGLLDIRRREWHREMLAVVDSERDLADCLPPLVGPDNAIGELRREVAAELGLPVGIPVASGGGDNMMAAIGTGNVVAGRLTVSLGTSGTIFAYVDKPVIDQGGALAAFCSSSGGWLPLLCTMNCTVSTELTRTLLGLSIDELNECVAAAPPGSQGILTLPFFNGERTPNLPNGKGCVLGLDDSNYSANNLLRSSMESAVYSLRAGLDAFRNLGCEINTIRLTGGGSRSDIWNQMVADVFDLPVSVQRIDEGAALGAALQALWMHQNRQSGAVPLRELVDQHLQIDEARGREPHSENAAAYTEYYRRYLRHVEAITPLYS